MSIITGATFGRDFLRGSTVFCDRVRSMMAARALHLGCFVPATYPQTSGLPLRADHLAAKCAFGSGPDQTAVYIEKLKPGRNDGEVRQGWRAI
ncbi:MULTISPECIES: hypothetical protein [Bradyrhizobium]|uniref:hypothetical protein n=1 Tax=Bradyrhizobium elkanii TaxID=29448 RepID=UPI0012BD1148|nr:hypothetical protein [Bradyrhizobium elkanii]